jgi:hypothetical protein
VANLPEMARSARPSDALRKPVPGPLFVWVKRASVLESAVFAALLVVWIAPGMKSATFVLGLGHGIGYVGLCIFIWIAILRREAPYGLLAASLTPVGPFGTLVGIELIERRGWGVASARLGDDASAPL